MESPRIAPLDPPYPPEMQAGFDRVMAGQPPLLLFRVVARNPRVLSRLFAGGLLDRGSVSLRQRELMILRTTARCGAEYEWGVHDTGDVDDALIVKLADALHDTGDVDDALWGELNGVFADEQLVELVQLAGFYHSVSFTLRAFRVPLEPSAPRFPPA